MSEKQAKPLVSVVLCTYNDEPYLRLAVDSILSQQGVEVELILVDDGSSDRAVQNIEDLKDPRVKVIKKANTGLTDSLNVGISHCRGEFIARQDADDIALPKRLETQVNFMRQHPEVGVLGSASRIIDDDGDALQLLQHPEQHQILLEKHIISNQFIHGALMVRKSVLKQIGGYRKEFVYSQDYDLTLRAQEVTQCMNLPDVLYQSRFGSNRISSLKAVEQAAFASMAKALAKQRRKGQKDIIQTGEYAGDFMMFSDPDIEQSASSVVKNDQVLLYLYLRAGLGEKARHAIDRISQSGESMSLSLRLKYVLTHMPKLLLRNVYRILDSLR